MVLSFNRLRHLGGHLSHAVVLPLDFVVWFHATHATTGGARSVASPATKKQKARRCTELVANTSAEQHTIDDCYCQILSSPEGFKSQSSQIRAAGGSGVYAYVEHMRCRQS